jgi:hypothetical protein
VSGIKFTTLIFAFKSENFALYLISENAQLGHFSLENIRILNN